MEGLLGFHSADYKNPATYSISRTYTYIIAQVRHEIKYYFFHASVSSSCISFANLSKHLQQMLSSVYLDFISGLVVELQKLHRSGWSCFSFWLCWIICASIRFLSID